MSTECNAAASPAAAPVARRARTGFLNRLRDVRQVCRQIFGIPDYERYLAHAAARHPGKPVLSRSAYCARAIEHKYGKGGQRCC
jgi:uncharacterized short protein YbdD (DUF466 family)